ncbi:MAG: ABC transporter substrate-binding protein [Firmicutes bacterium]|nr:ABC transporter substrate-binding protein [Bacillota bacterium]
MKKFTKIICVALCVILVSGFATMFVACKPKPVTVTFEYSAGNRVTREVNSGQRIPGDKIPSEPKPTSEKVFDFWSDDGTTDYIAKKSPGSDVTLRPVFRNRRQNEVVVWFDSDGGSYVKSLTVISPGTVTKPTDPTLANAEFDGWKLTGGEGGEFDWSAPITHDTFLKALWIEGKGKILVQSSGDFDGVFSPFFSTSAYDAGIVGETQIGMLSSDRQGLIYVGEDVPSVAKDYNFTTYLYGEENPSSDKISDAMEQTTITGKDFYTEYNFVIKNGIKFSDGSDLTIKDVLFNMYAFLDPVYTGSSTMYSTNILGLQAYRMQNDQIGDRGDVDNNAAFSNLARKRRTNLTDYFEPEQNRRNENRKDIAAMEPYSDGRSVEQTVMEDAYRLREMFWRELKSDAVSAWSSVEGVAKDYWEYGFEDGEYWKVFLLMEGLLEVKYKSNGEVDKWPNQGADPALTGTPGYPKKIGDPWVVFDEAHKYEFWEQEDLIKIVFNGKMGIMGTDNGNYNSIDWKNGVTTERPKVDFTVDAAGNITGLPIGNVATDKNSTNTFVGRVNNTSTFSRFLTAGLREVALYWGSGGELFSYMTAEERSIHYKKSLQDGLAVPTISGITVDKVRSFKDIDGVVKTYNNDHYVLKIKIFGVDPKAILNFAFSVSPMSYYSNPAGKGPTGFNSSDGYLGFKYPGVDGHTDPQTAHLGFKQLDFDYFNKIFRHTDIQGVPVGAGAFRATNAAGNKVGPGVTAVEFYADSQVNFRRNDYFYTTGADMNNVRFEYMKVKVIDTTKVVEALRQRDIHVGDPNAKQQNVDELKKIPYLDSQLIRNNGYGYVGINARFVPDIEIRQAIMTALNKDLIRNYYKNPDLCELINRGLSLESWAYPKGASDAYPYLSEQEAEIAIRTLVSAAGFKDAPLRNGAYTKNAGNDGTRDLKFTFTIAGASTDHPAFDMFLDAAKLLNKCGFNITVKPDPYALAKLPSGLLEVWAAAWGAGIDPDMYQVYHKKSTATSTTAWGYRYLLDEGRGTADELKLIDDLSKLIDAARQTTVQLERTRIYAEALSYVMDLAVEYPTYQRSNLIAYNRDIIDVTTLAPGATPFYGPFAEVWNIRLR